MWHNQDINVSLIRAVRQGKLNRARELINLYGLSYSEAWSKGYVLLCEALKNRHLEMAKLLLTSGSKVNSKNSYQNPSNTPLHLAAINGDIEIIKMLLNRGADINAKNFNGKTPLHDAIENNKVEITELLLKHGADVNASHSNAQSPLQAAMQKGNLQIVEMLLKNGAYINCVISVYTSRWENDYTPLHFAVEKGSLEVMKLLLNRGANVDAKAEDDVTPLHIAAKKGYLRIAEDLLNQGACIHSLTLKKGYTPLHLASELGNEESVKLFLNRGANIDASTKGNLTPLYVAVKEGNMRVVRLLLRHGAKVDNQDTDSKTILHLAVEKGHLMIVEEVLKYCPDINNQSNRSSLNTAVYSNGEEFKKIVEALLEYGLIVNPENANNPKLLHIAIEKGYLKIVSDLLKYGADVNMLHKLPFFESLCLSPLHRAVKYKQEEVAKLLMDYKANINAQGKDGKTPIFYAIENADLKITKLLLADGANVKDNPELLNLAVKKGYIEIVQALLQHDAEINAKTGKTAIFYAIANADLKITKLLLTNGANVKDNPEPLNIAVEKGYIEIVEALLQYNADVNASDVNGKTALHLTATLRDFENSFGSRTDKDPNVNNIKGEIAKLLLNQGANVNAQTKNGETTLHIATQNGYVQIVEALLKHKADVNASDVYGKTALHLTATLSDFKDSFRSRTDEDPNVNSKGEIAKLLLNQGANADAQTKNGVTTLHIATQNGYAQVVEVLLEYNANVNSRVKSDITPLHLSAQRGDEEISKMLLNKGANLDAKQKNGITALHIATLKGHKEIVKLLLERGAKVDSKGKRDITPLHLGAQEGHQEIIETILKFGADINSRDEYGRTALHIASHKKHVKVVTTLLEYGSDINIISRNYHTPLDYAMVGSGPFNERANKTIEIIKRHIVQMKTANLYVSKKNLLSVKLAIGDEISNFQDKCEVEITSMKSEKINNYNISFYDILSKITNSLAICLRNENIVHILKLDDYKTKFPIYASMIKSRFRNAMKRKELLEQSNKIIFFFLNNSPHLPQDCTEKILSYLSDEDLKHFNECL
ncbi:ankyrin-3-like [Chrysoperla carnea]|uniref:ankyrin-3-like n=1 Tax=Chrysoperla carnea TaxID=189513 RepID=UPI001D099E68|nr:ankyrin-3-like [Chrysoperla carnea]